MERTFNLGVGMIGAVHADRAQESLELLTARGVDAWIIGDVVTGTGRVELSSGYAGSPTWAAAGA